MNGKWARRGLVALVVAVLATAAVSLVIARVGRWLVVSSPLGPARAIVVLGGDFPIRAAEAGTIFRQGWAPEVWLLPAESRLRDSTFTRLGLAVPREDLWNRAVLERLGVPTSAIRVLNGRVRNTADEIQVVAGELQKEGGGSIIIVASKAQSRRVAAIWRSVMKGAAPAVVRYPVDDPFDPTGWWTRTEDALAVSREVFGLLNVWAGFPVRPDRATR